MAIPMRTSDRRWDVLSPRRLMGPLDVGVRQLDGPGEQVRLQLEVPTVLLATQDDQRRPVVPSVDDGPRVAETRRRVEADQGRRAAALGEAVRHPHDNALVKAEHIAEVVGESLEKPELGGTRVAEHGCEPEGAEHPVRRFPDCDTHGSPGGGAAKAWICRRRMANHSSRCRSGASKSTPSRREILSRR